MNTSQDLTGVDGLTITRGLFRGGRDRVMRRMIGFGAGLDYGVHGGGLMNLARGIAERVLYVRRDEGLGKAPQPVAGVFEQRLGPLRDSLVEHMCRTPVVPRDEFPLLYSGRKRVIYQRAVDSLTYVAVSLRDAVVKTFVKAEKINFTKKVDPAPRVIQPRSPRYNVEVGRYLKLFEKEAIRGFEKLFGYPVILKGRNAEGVAAALRGSWDSFVRPVAVGLDATRFDQHVSRAALEWEHSVYNGVFRSGELRRLLSWQLRNRGVGFVDGWKVEYSVDGCRMSGDMNTGLGNCILMSAMVLAYVNSRGIRARLANNGDDCVLMVEKSDLASLDRLDDWMLDFGFTLTREAPVEVFEQIEFCQAQPVCVGGVWRMIRDPLTTISKDMVSLHGWETELDIKYWLYSVGECGSALNAGVPIGGVLYPRLASLGLPPSSAWVDASGRSGAWYMARGLSSSATNPDDDTRVSYYRAFGIMPDLQVDIEREAANTTIDFRPVMLQEHLEASSPLAILRRLKR